MFVYLVITFQVYFPMASKDILIGFCFLRGGGLGQLIETHHIIIKIPRKVTVTCKKENAMYCMYFRGQSEKQAPKVKTMNLLRDETVWC